MSKWQRKKKKLVLIPVFVAVFLAAKSVAVMLLWNALVPELFHGPEVTYVQALGLVVLVKVLIGFPGRGGGFGRFGRFGRGGPGGGGPWGDMTPEDREKLRAQFESRMREKFGDANRTP